VRVLLNRRLAFQQETSFEKVSSISPPLVFSSMSRDSFHVAEVFYCGNETQCMAHITLSGANTRPLPVYVLQALLFFQAANAIAGGGALVVDPSGTLLKMPLEMLRYSPFHDFLIPGLVLLIVLGIIPLITFFGLVRRPVFVLAQRINIDRNQHWSHTFSFYTGVTLILWIDFQVMFLQNVHMLHLIFSLLGVAIVIVSQMPGVREYYRKQ